MPAFREHAQIASVNMIADEDSKLRHYRLIEDRLPGSPRSMAAMLAGSDVAGPNAFLIDYGIARNSISRLSYVDVLLGRVDPAAVAGRRSSSGFGEERVPGASQP